MTERDEETGQFASEPEQLVGHAGLEADAGYVPMPDEEPEADSDALTAEEASELLTSMRTPEGDIQTYVNGAGLADNVTMTIEQGAKALTDIHAADETEADQARDDQIRKEVDELRAAAWPDQPTEAKGAESEPDIEAVLNNPRIKEAISLQINEVETARQHHLAGLTAATQIAQGAFMARFPEFAHIPVEQRAQAVATMQQQDPARFAQIAQAVAESKNLFDQHQAESQRNAERERTQSRAYAKAESARFESMIANVPKAERSQIEAGVVAKIKEYGGDVDQFARLLSSSEFANATVQRLLWDVGRLHKIESSAKAVASRDAPRVQKPGTSRSRSPGDMDLAALDRKLSTTGSIRDAANLFAARRATGR